MARQRRIDSFPILFAQVIEGMHRDPQHKEIRWDAGSPGIAVNKRQDFYQYRLICLKQDVGDYYHNLGKKAERIKIRLEGSELVFFWLDEGQGMDAVRAQLPPDIANFTPPPPREGFASASREELKNLKLPGTDTGTTKTDVYDTVYGAPKAQVIPIAPAAPAASPDNLTPELQRIANDVIAHMAGNPGKASGRLLPPDIVQHWQKIVDLVELDGGQTGKWKFCLEQRGMPGLGLCWDSKTAEGTQNG